jgi:hypothetical protein
MLTPSYRDHLGFGLHSSLNRSVLRKHESVVLKTTATTHNFHLHVPLVVPIKNGLDNMGLAICDVEKYTVIPQYSRDLLLLAYDLRKMRSNKLVYVTNLHLYIPR